MECINTLTSGAVLWAFQELLGELNLGHMRSGVPMLAVSLALEAKASVRELTSRLLSDLCGRVLTLRDVETAFHKLLRELPDLVLDTPGAPQVSPLLGGTFSGISETCDGQDMSGRGLANITERPQLI